MRGTYDEFTTFLTGSIETWSQMLAIQYGLPDPRTVQDEYWTVSFVKKPVAGNIYKPDEDPGYADIETIQFARKKFLLTASKYAWVWIRCK